jgi:Zn-dependent protease
VTATPATRHPQERRLWPNPNRHLEHLGTLVGLFAGLGWGRHVHIKPYLMKVHPALGGVIVGLAGPAANGLLAALGLLAMRGFSVGPDAPWSTWPSPAEWLTVWVQMNIALAIFNLLPLYPLDGYYLIHDVLPLKAMAWWESMTGRTMLILGVGLGAVLLMPIPLYQRLASPPILAVYDLIGWR